MGSQTCASLIQVKSLVTNWKNIEILYYPKYKSIKISVLKRPKIANRLTQHLVN